MSDCVILGITTALSASLAAWFAYRLAVMTLRLRSQVHENEKEPE